jgi:hemolysin III
VLAFVWSCAIGGVVLKTVYFDAVPEGLGLAMYLAFGWLGALSGIALARTHGRRCLVDMLLGGVAYSLGGVASVVEAPTLLPGVVGHHELFHAAVLAALFLHWRWMADLGRLRGGAAARRVVAPVVAAPVRRAA